MREDFREQAAVIPRDAPRSSSIMSGATSAQHHLSKLQKLQLEYWTEFVGFLQRRGSFLDVPPPQPRSWIAFDVGRHYCQLASGISFRDKHIGVGLTLSGPAAKRYFLQLRQEQVAIEREIGAPLQWSERSGQKESYISLHCNELSDPANLQEWHAQFAWLCATLEAFHKAFSPRLKRLKSGAPRAASPISPAPPANLANVAAGVATASTASDVRSVRAALRPLESESSFDEPYPANEPRLAALRHDAPKIFASAQGFIASGELTQTVVAWGRAQQQAGRLPWIISAALVLLMCFAFIAKFSRSDSFNYDNLPADAVSGVTLKTTDGTTFSLSRLRGHIVVLNFWATWCVPSVQEIAALNGLQRDYTARGVTVVGVSWDDLPNQIKRFERERINPNYTVLLDGQSLRRKFGNITGLPVTFVIDEHGRIRQTLPGASNRAAFEEALRPLMMNAP